jgi:hypothetical protein
MLTAERLRELLHYDPDTGVFTWLRVKGRRVRVGALSGKANGGGYFQIGVDGRIYYAHRLAWLYVHGEWPVASIDHVNCDRCDNRLANLRPATKAQNAANARKRTNNSSGFKGAYWNARRNKWMASIEADGHQRHLGYFDNPTDAHKAYVAAAERHFGEFARSE